MSAPLARTVSVWEQYVGGSGLTLTLAGLLAVAVAWPIQEARWVAHMPPLTVITVVGLVLAVASHRRSWSPPRSHLTALGIGAAVVAGSAVAMTPGVGLGRVVNLVNELDFWFSGIFTDQVRGGVLEFGIFMLALLWSLGYWGGWLALRKQRGWATVLIGGVVLAFVLANIAGGTTRWLALFMGASVLLLIHMSTVRRLVGWRAKRLSFETTVVLSQSGVVLLFGLVVVLLISLLPTPRVAPLGVLADALQRSVETVEAHFTRLFNGLPSRLSYKTLVWENETHFRGNPNLTDQLLFTVEGTRGTYWRARTYTTYTGTGWDTSAESEWVNFAQAVADFDQRRVARSHFFRIAAATDTLFSGGLPVRYDQSAEALVSPDGPFDILQVRYGEGREFFPTRINLRYASVGTESIATPDELREADTEYPEEVVETYLQLPPTLPGRVRDLAESIVAEENNPYDQALAVRDHVIAFNYNLEIPGPPEGRDGVDYFLFDLRQGYCDYYASSMAVLLRAVGIPSRYVLGYASGTRKGGRDVFEVLDLNYHSWVEAYFPEYGWIPFEPTPPNAIEFGGGSSFGPPNIDEESALLEGVGALDEEELDELIGDFSIDGGTALDARVVVYVLLGTAALIIAVVWYRWWWRLRRLARPDEIYAKMLRLATLIGFPQRAHQTPHEYALALSAQVPEHAAQVRTIAVAYERRRYAGRSVPLSDLRDAEEAWKRLRWVLFFRLFRVTPA